MMENSFDNAHFAFVHKGTFGDIDQPKPEKYELTETHYGFVADTIDADVGNIQEAVRTHQISVFHRNWFVPCHTPSSDAR